MRELLAKAGKGKRWRNDIGVGRVRVPGKPRRKGPSYRGRRSGTRSAQSGGISWGQAFLAVMTGGVSLLFRGGGSSTPVSGSTSRPRKKVRKTANIGWYSPELQVSLPTRTTAQVERAIKKLDQLRQEIAETEDALQRSKSSGAASSVARLTKTLGELRHFEKQWRKQARLLQEESGWVEW